MRRVVRVVRVEEPTVCAQQFITLSRGRLGVARTSSVLVAAALLTVTIAPLRAVRAEQTAQSLPAEAPAFEVVSIREDKSGELVQTIQRPPGGRITYNNFPLRRLILEAFGLQSQQLVSAPDWIDSTRYDVIAQTSGELPVTAPGTVGPLNLMMQRMLAERFNLAVHRERRELPIYALTVARGDGRLGPRISKAAIDCQALRNEITKRAKSGDAPPAAPQRPDGGPGCGMTSRPGQVTAGDTSMAALARFLAFPVGRIVEDRTRLAGGFDFDLEFTVDPALAGATAGAPALPPSNANATSIFTALEEQLGLKLQADRAPVEVLVIDRVERPTEN
jgi:uncharacterized protein (TIGR03435 family)